MAGEAGNLTNANVRVRIDNVRKVFNGRNGEMVALNGVSLDIHDNEFICVVGPSGCGKSTLLNIIAGLLEPTEGKVFCDGKEVLGTGTERGVVFQQYALFPWLTVKKNVMFALEMRGVKGKQAEEEAMRYLEMVDLSKFADHYPKELSGGMKQRVAIARAYAAEPEVLLMDEPFGALAANTPFDLALVDIEMESTTAGIRAAEHILENKPEALILFLTAHETENMILMSMGAGAVDYIVKGCPEEELLRHIRSAYQGEALLDARVQHTVLKEYSRLRRSERSLLFFINNVSQLTPAERALVRCLLDGYKVREIAQIRCVEVVTVKTQIKGLLRKFGCTRTKEIVEMIRELNVEHLF